MNLDWKAEWVLAVLSVSMGVGGYLLNDLLMSGIAVVVALSHRMISEVIVVENAEKGGTECNRLFTQFLRRSLPHIL